VQTLYFSTFKCQEFKSSGQSKQRHNYFYFQVITRKKTNITPPETKLYRIQDKVVYLTGLLKLNKSEMFVRLLLKELKNLKSDEIFINLDELEDIDSSGIVALFFIQKRLKREGITTTIYGGSDTINKKLELFKPESNIIRTKPSQAGFLEKLGTDVSHFFNYYVYEFIVLAADIFYWSFTDIFRSKTRREGEFVNQTVLIGVNAVLIVVFMSFIIGLVMALHASYQLRTFGANIYIVDLVVIAMMSQMGPLITAILVAGRSGSSIAAEIATMKVTSELDALKTMGLNPIRFVVVPKLYASLLTLPFLIILANVFGIIGGAVAANTYLGITPEIFINRMGNVMQNKDLFTGFIKSQVYASLIVLTGSFYGFRVVRGAEGVGKATTTSVVVAISLVILADSILGLLFY
jgi:phospholipid/cholesterol/gamma-HCH transport system permease protein